MKLRRKPDKRINQDPVKLWRHRVAAQMTMSQLAKKAGISKGHLSELEKAQPSRSASPDMLARLADALGCEITDLMPEDPDGRAA
jgi:transcriptional regulator with XRE-family HTH domain